MDPPGILKDAEIKMVIDFHENGILPDDDQKARELLISKEQYHLENDILYYVAADKTLRLIPPMNSCLEKHIVGHLREAKAHGELCKHYWWKTMRADIRKWCSGCLVCVQHINQVGQHIPH